MASVRVSVPTSLHSRHGIERDCEAAQGGDTRAEKIPLEPHAVNPIPRGRASKCPRPAVEIKCVVRPMLGFKSFRSARIILSAIELMHERERTNADGRGAEAISR